VRCDGAGQLFYAEITDKRHKADGACSFIRFSVIDGACTLFSAPHWQRGVVGHNVYWKQIMLKRDENMETGKTTAYFLGANSRYGFYSLYDGFADLCGGDFLWVIKGGPGCGKSSFMKRIGRAMQEAGQPVEYIFCSGDPDSLDGIWLPEKRTGYVDGTAPHVIEAQYPGTASLYLDLGAFYDAGALESELGRICDINAHYKALYARAYELISAGALLAPKCEGTVWGEREKAIIDRRISGLAARELKRAHGPGSIKTRFISALTCRGRVFLQETVEALCERVYSLDNELGLARYYLAALADQASALGSELILCPDPVDPKQLEGVLLPELGLGFIASGSGVSYNGPVWRHVRLDALPERAAVAGARSEVRLSRRLSAQTFDSAVQKLAEAETLHDELEAVYNSHVDFDGLYSAADDHICYLMNGA
jgi:hypothetical protein